MLFIEKRCHSATACARTLVQGSSFLAIAQPADSREQLADITSRIEQLRHASIDAERVYTASIVMQIEYSVVKAQSLTR
ncbi:hypothetical protein XH97_05840 [Bradyrhizobium sp. CCBAU 53380]|nr:hypothetical protein [Bradyrhizobium sp. CCBAU 53380]